MRPIPLVPSLWCIRLLLLLLALLPIRGFAQAGSPFGCDVVFYQVRSGAGQSLIIKYPAISGSVTPTAALPTALAPQLNAMGYNPLDNYLYAVESGTANVYRIGSSGYTLVGSLVNTVPGGASMAGVNVSGGGFDGAGRYYFFSQSGAPTAEKIFRVDQFPVAGNVNVVHQYDIAGAALGNPGDIDFNGAGGPNGLLLAATGTRFLRIQLQANTTTPGIGTATNTEFVIPTVGTIGSAFYDAFASRFYVFNNGTNQFWEIVNPQTGTPTTALTSPPAYVGPPAVPGTAQTDGTSCPLSGQRVTDLSIEKSDGNTTVTTNQVVAYSITVTNAGPYPANYSVVADPAQPGLQKLSVTCSAPGGPPAAVCPPGLTTSTFETGVTINTFPPATQLVFTLNALITPTIGPVTNVATVTPAIDTTDTNPSNNRATDTNAISGTAPNVISGASICPVGTVESLINHVANGNFSATAPFSTAASITGALNILQSNSAATPSFVARQSGQRTYNPFGAPAFTVLQNAFPGDPARSVPGGNEWLIANGKFTGAAASLNMWQQAIGGLTGGRTYQAMFYVSNAAQPGQTPVLVPLTRPQVATTTSSFLTGTLTLTNETIAAGDRWTLLQGLFTMSASGTATLSIADVTTPASARLRQMCVSANPIASRVWSAVRPLHTP
jgi:uncharacterized repeat protein (TIGR01451 family)